MCRWLSYIGTPIFLDEIIFEQENSLINQSKHATYSSVTTNGDGFGVGWYGTREAPGVYHEVLPAWNDKNLRNLAHQLSSGLFLAHVRASTGTDTSRTNCHPFRKGNWLFMHNGMIGGYARIRRDLERMIPDEIYPNRLGTTDSEVFFHLLFSEGVDEDPVGALSRTVKRVLGVMKGHDIREPFRMTALLTDGKSVYALRYATDPEPPSLFWWPQQERLLIVSEPLDSDISHWRDVPPQHLLISRGHGDTVTRPFELAA